MSGLVVTGSFSFLLKEDPAHIRQARAIAKQSPNRREVLRREKADFERSLRKIPAIDRAKLRDALEGLRFIDFEHTAPALIEAFCSRGKYSFLDYELQNLYNRNESSEDPEFDNVKKLNRYLRKNEAPPSIERL